MRRPYLIGQTLERFIPFKPGRYLVKIVDRRVPKEGEYIMEAGGQVFIRKGSAFLSKRDREHEYWIVEIVP